MPLPLEIRTTVDDSGRLPKKYSRWIAEHLQLYAGREVAIRIKAPTRSTRANAYYWGAIISPIRTAMIEAGIGFFETDQGIKAVTSDAIHEWFKSKYLPPRTAVVFGDDVTLRPSTQDLDSTQFSDYIEAIRNDPQVRMIGVHFDDAEDLRGSKIADLPY